MTSVAGHGRADLPGAVPQRAAVRWALAVALILGVLGMHTLVGPPAAAGDTGTASTAEVPGPVSVAVAHGGVGGAARADQPATLGGGSAPVGGHSPADGHSMLTVCLAVLGAFTFLALFAAALTRRPALLDPPAASPRVPARVSLGRPPPWTVRSLHQLSLLRV